jgi:D-alanyl-D-alanine-carboxypeptidase/D-alanyl-D-alanine-endopeptidase
MTGPFASRSLVAAAVILAAALPVRAQTAAVAAAPSDDYIRQIITARIDTHRQSVGIVVGIVDSAGTRVVSHGELARGDARKLDAGTLFEIGSVTKVFTSLLLADAVGRGEVSLDEPVAKYLPDTVKVPERNGRLITLQDLATHTSGLPRLPTNLTPKDASDPYADYTVAQMYAFLSGYVLTRDVGAQFEYSNLGAGLLGHALALRARTDYETLVRTRILEPLGMTSTTITLTPSARANLAIGHNPALEPVANWELSTLAGAGALRSNANDMLTFLRAVLGQTSSPLAPAMAAMVRERRPTGGPTMEVGLGWMVLKALGPDLIWHNGGTGGYRSFLGYNPATGVGVVVLSNTTTPAGVDDIGFHLLDARSPLLAADSPLLRSPATRAAVTIPSAVFDRYVGTYQLAPGAVVTMSRQGERFFTQLTGQPTIEIFPESETRFFLKVVDAQLTFEVDAQGRATAVVLHQNGRNQRAPRTE